MCCFSAKKKIIHLFIWVSYLIYIFIFVSVFCEGANIENSYLSTDVAIFKMVFEVDMATFSDNELQNFINAYYSSYSVNWYIGKKPSSFLSKNFFNCFWLGGGRSFRT